ncbi:hypothetical protein ACFQZ4_11065 [Catellatospora coxensis]
MPGTSGQVSRCPTATAAPSSAPPDTTASSVCPASGRSIRASAAAAGAPAALA